LGHGAEHGVVADPRTSGKAKYPIRVLSLMGILMLIARLPGSQVSIF
jgi:hypothetical protein